MAVDVLLLAVALLAVDGFLAVVVFLAVEDVPLLVVVLCADTLRETLPAVVELVRVILLFLLEELLFLPNKLVSNSDSGLKSRGSTKITATKMPNIVAMGVRYAANKSDGNKSIICSVLEKIPSGINSL